MLVRDFSFGEYKKNDHFCVSLEESSIVLSDGQEAPGVPKQDGTMASASTWQPSSLLVSRWVQCCKHSKPLNEMKEAGVSLVEWQCRFNK